MKKLWRKAALAVRYSWLKPLLPTSLCCWGVGDREFGSKVVSSFAAPEDEALKWIQTTTGPPEGPEGLEGFCKPLQQFLCYLKQILHVPSYSIGWQGFTDCLPLLWHPDVFLLTLPSLPASASCWRWRDFLWVFSGSCFSFYQALLSCRSQSRIQKDCASGKAAFTTSQHYCIHLLWDNHELWTHLQPWMQSRLLLDELPPLWCWMVPSGVDVPT